MGDCLVYGGWIVFYNSANNKMDLLYNRKEIVMTHLIDKDALIEKLWERRVKNRDFGGSPYSEYGHEDDEILSLINSLEVKEVDEDPYVMGKTGKFTTTTK